VWQTALHQHPYAALQWGIVILVATGTALWELRSRRVTVPVTTAVLAAGLASSALIGGVGGLAESGLAAALLALPYLILQACARGGAPEARLMAALGAWLGVIQGAVLLLSAGIAAFLLGLAVSLGGRRLSLALPDGARAVLGTGAGEGQLPQGPAILLGSVFAAAWSMTWL